MGHSTTESELTVIGSSQVQLPLKGRPKKVRVRFVDDSVSVPCNPSVPDDLSWSVFEQASGELGTRFKKSYTLQISWTVSGKRIIRWEVSY
jgi:hypothetical protein